MGVLVREREKGEWWVFINHHGKRKAKKIGRDERTAKEVAKKIEARLALGEFEMEEAETKKVPTYQEYSDLWLSECIKPVDRESTYERYGEVLKQHINPVIGKIPIDQVKRTNVRSLLVNLLKKRSHQEYRHFHKECHERPADLCR